MEVGARIEEAHTHPAPLHIPGRAERFSTPPPKHDSKATVSPACGFAVSIESQTMLSLVRSQEARRTETVIEDGEIISVEALIPGGTTVLEKFKLFSES
ncbi:hypothetical protein ACMFMG_007756 [Clarireedia jacksonii]